jgi:hypothetical protein
VQLEADLLDYLRYPTNTKRCTTITSRSNSQAFESLCNGPAADPDPAVRLFGYLSNTDDWMEGRSTNGCFDIGKRRRESRLCFRFPKSSSRRSHRRTQDQFDCMWAERHHPANICNDFGLAREYLYQNLMRHIRKMSFSREHRSF